MSEHNWCHGPECHTYSTVDRVRGVKGNKVLRTRKVKVSTYGDANMSWNWFCSHGCERDFWNKYGNQIRQIAPRTEPLETPIDVVVETRTNWRGEPYKQKLIKEVDNESTNSVG